MAENIDRVIEERALRQAGLIGRGGEMGNILFAMDYGALPPEAFPVIQRIMSGGPFPHRQDGTPFGNRFGDLPSGDYLEFTVPTPGLPNRGARRIVARRNGILFFTACHYERVQGRMSPAERVARTLDHDAQWRNGFYVITGIGVDQRARIKAGLARIAAIPR